jgi:hypothetical protein
VRLLVDTNIWLDVALNRAAAVWSAALLREREQRGLAGPGRSHGMELAGWVEGY